jgi:hypothetical protein
MAENDTNEDEISPFMSGHKFMMELQVMYYLANDLPDCNQIKQGYH